MKTSTLLSALVAIGGVSATPTKSLQEPPTKRAGLPTVSASGNAFYADGKRFYVRGIDYQPGGSSANIDPLADTSICKRDIAYFKQLGINTVRVYSVDNSKNHDECMSALADAGIYLVLDVNNSQYSLNRIDPFPSYNTDYLQSVFATVDAFAKYDNTLAYFSGNEVINDTPGTDKAAPYIKAVTRDMKNYIGSRKLRPIPVGYSAADVTSNRMQTAMYMNCGSDDMRSDFFAFNDYSWCNSDFVTSGWDQKVKNFTNYGLPIFLSEWGCIKNRPRKFDELTALMSSQMDAVYSGGIMYEYSNEDNDYGIVTIKGNSVTKLDEFALFANALKDNPSPSGSGGAATTTHSVDCPSQASGWDVNPSEVPSMPEEAEKFFKNGAGTGPGLNGPGSQNSSKSGTASGSVTSGVPSSTSTGSSDDDSAAATMYGGMDHGALLVTGLTVFFTIFGALIL